MTQSWQELTSLSGGAPLVVERVRLANSGITIEGGFDLPPLAQISAEDQVFVAAFLRSHGSIKEMERVFGVSYPTVKNRLNRISDQLEFVETDPVPSQMEVLRLLRLGEISATEAIERLSP